MPDIKDIQERKEYSQKDELWRSKVKWLFSEKSPYRDVANLNMDRIIEAVENMGLQKGQKIFHIGLKIPCLVTCESLVEDLVIMGIDYNRKIIKFEDECWKYYEKQLKSKDVRFNLIMKASDIAGSRLYWTNIGSIDVVTMFDQFSDPDEEASHRNILKIALDLVKHHGSVWVLCTGDAEGQAEKLLLEELEQRKDLGYSWELIPNKRVSAKLDDMAGKIDVGSEKQPVPECNVAYLITKAVTISRDAEGQAENLLLEELEKTGSPGTSWKRWYKWEV